MEDTIPGHISLNDTVAQCAMCMVIEGYHTKQMSLVNKAIEIMKAFKDVPMIEIDKKFRERLSR